MEVTIETSPVFDWCVNSTNPIVVQSGGTSSGKTYSILQYLIAIATSQERLVITVAGQDIPNLKKGAYRDAQNILYGTDAYLQELIFHNKSNREFIFNTGSVIEFNSYSDFQDAKSGKRDYLFVNEANGVGYEIFEELQVRTTKQTFIDFNPTARFWAHDKFHGKDHVDWFNSTYRDNPFIEPSIREKIESYEPTPENIARGTANEYRWKVYGLGEVGRLEGLVFPDFQVSSEFPTEYKWRVFGMDFGFTNDPTTLVEIRYAHGNLYWMQHIYEKRLTNPDIVKEIKRLGLEDERIIADSAEPKSIQEIQDGGCYVDGAVKGKDSINQGVDAIKRYKSYIYSGSKDLIEEFSSYTWAKDRDGNATNKPIDKFNHGIDAGRYALSDKILEPDNSDMVTFL